MTARRSTGQRSKGRQQQIREAAAKLFSTKGYASTSTQDIADEVGILKPSLYYHIRSKQDLLVEIFSEIHDDVARIVEEIESTPGLSPRERLHLWVVLHVRHVFHHQVQIAVFYQEVGTVDEEGMAPILKKREAYERFVAQLIADDQADRGIETPIDPKLLSLLTFGVLNWLHTWYRPRGERSDRYLMALCAEFIVGGLASLDAGRVTRVRDQLGRS